jgi:MFS family permease
MVLQAITMAIVAPIAGRLSDRFEPRIIATSGCLIMACAFGLLDRINDTTPLYYIGACLLTLGFGFGLFTTPNNNAALSSVDKERLGIATVMNLIDVSLLSGFGSHNSYCIVVGDNVGKTG